VLPMLSYEYQLSYSVSGFLLSSHSIGNLFSSFVAGLVPFYLGKKKSIMLLSSCILIGFAMMTVWGNPIWLIAAFWMTGFGRGSVSNFNNAMVNEISNSSTFALNLLHSFFAIGAFLAPFFVIACTRGGTSGWRTAVLLVVALGLFTLLSYTRMNIKNDKPVKGEKQKIDYGFLKQPHFWISAGLLFFYLCAENGINGWIVTYFIKSEVMSKAYAQTLAGILWLVILIGRLICGALSSRVSKKAILLTTTSGVCAFFVLLISTANIVVITISIIGLGFFMAGIYPTTVANVGSTIKAYPMAMSVLLTIAGIGAIAMPSIVGTVAEFAGIAGGMSLITVAVIIMFVFAVVNAVRKQSEQA